jgi:hypothetical protein
VSRVGLIDGVKQQVDRSHLAVRASHSQVGTALGNARVESHYDLALGGELGRKNVGHGSATLFAGHVHAIPAHRLILASQLPGSAVGRWPRAQLPRQWCQESWPDGANYGGQSRSDLQVAEEACANQRPSTGRHEPRHGAWPSVRRAQAGAGERRFLDQATSLHAGPADASGVGRVASAADASAAGKRRITSGSRQRVAAGDTGVWSAHGQPR